MKLHHEFRQTWPDGTPRTLSQKIQYKLMHDRRPIVRLYSDKIAVRDYVRRYAPGLALPRLLGVHDHIEDLRAHIPPPPWVMKAAHGSGMVLISCPPNCPPYSEIIERAQGWLQTDYSFRYWEWQYFRLPRRVLFEAYLGREGEVPDDYKFYVIHQQVRMITVDKGRFAHHCRSMFLPDWTPLPGRVGRPPPPEVPPAPPARLDEMISIAQSLARDTDFLRVDLYVIGDTLYFGELTHGPSAGGLFFSEPWIDEQLGGHWKLPAAYQ